MTFGRMIGYKGFMALEVDIKICTHHNRGTLFIYLFQFFIFEGVCHENTVLAYHQDYQETLHTHKKESSV